jgi:hypothetical protein
VKPVGGAGDVERGDARAGLRQRADVLPSQPAQAAGDNGNLTRQVEERVEERVADR